MMASKDEFMGPVNLGNPGEFTIKELADLILEMIPAKSKVVYMDLPKDDPMQRKPDITLAHEMLDGWSPKIALKEGLVYAVEYFKKII